MSKILKRNIATFYLILMGIQIIPIEGYEVSMIKFGAMCLTPLIFLIATPKFSKAFAYGFLYFLCMLLVGLYHSNSFRFSTVGYALSFIFMYITYYNLVYCEKVFTIDYFIKIIQRLIIAYAVVLVLQQLVHLVGVGNFPLFNTLEIYERGWLSGNSLSIEPSHSARIIIISLFALIRMREIKYGNNQIIKSMYKESKITVYCFLWCMLTMGSGTGFIGLMLIMTYFIKRKYMMYIIPALVAIIVAIPYIEYEPLQRALTALEISQTMDSDLIHETDMSASARILPYINTINEFDITSATTWLGEGIDSAKTEDKWGLTKMIGGMSDYGFITYIFALLLVFKTSIRRFFSVETLIFIVLLMAEIRSIYVWWFAFMIFTTTRYFQIQKEKGYDFTN